MTTVRLPPANYQDVKILLEFLDDKIAGRLTQEQLELACIFWACDRLDRFAYAPLPAEPLALREWRELHHRQKDAASDEVKNRMSGMFHGFWREYSSINNENKAQLTYLLEAEQRIRKHSAARADKVLAKTREYTTRGVESWS